MTRRLWLKVDKAASIFYRPESSAISLNPKTLTILKFLTPEKAGNGDYLQSGDSSSYLPDSSHKKPF